MRASSVFVVGHRGMLGHVVLRRLTERGMRVVTTEERYAGALDDRLVAAVTSSSCEVVINCVGLRKSPASDPSAIIRVNGMLPLQLAAGLGKSRMLVHASSDGVFAGNAAPYEIDHVPDATDAYGLSKRMGEALVPGTTVVTLRTSIIGPDAGPPRSLLHWYLNAKVPVQGFTNHHWNGITTLAWADLALRAANGELPTGIHQPACEAPVTKAELLGAIRTTWQRGVDVTAVPAPQTVDRRLVPTVPCAPIADQLSELRRWMES